MAMTSVCGHLLEPHFAGNFDSWNSCKPVTLFNVEVIKRCVEDYKDIKDTLEREIRSCQGLIIWTDCDREGENIGFEIIKVCTDIKPDIPVYRARFSVITEASVFEALNNLREPDKKLSDAVEVRRELDLRTGAAFTRLQTLGLQKTFPEQLGDKILSYGSCQFPTLGFVVEKYRAMDEFVAQSFWKIKMNHKIKDLTVDYIWKRGRMSDENECKALFDICQKNPSATVKELKTKPRGKYRPLPLNTVELIKTVSRKLKINAKDTMKTAEKLYMLGYITYPRTETTIFPKDFNLVPFLEKQCVDYRWGTFARRILSEGPNPRQGRNSEVGRYPIFPLQHAKKLTGNDELIYEFITRHFLACLSKNAEGIRTQVHVDIAGETFYANGLEILQMNYLDIYVYENCDVKRLHKYNTGKTFTPELNLAEENTVAPSLLTETDLIAVMETHGIGTDATYAEHIHTIKSREYMISDENTYLIPSALGVGLIEGYNNIKLEGSLVQPHLRAEFENELKLICEGRKEAEVVRRQQIEKYKRIFKEVQENLTTICNAVYASFKKQVVQTANPVTPKQQIIDNWITGVNKTGNNQN